MIIYLISKQTKKSNEITFGISSFVCQVKDKMTKKPQKTNNHREYI